MVTPRQDILWSDLGLLNTAPSATDEVLLHQTATGLAMRIPVNRLLSNSSDPVSLAEVYTLVKTILGAGANITITPDDANHTLTLVATGGGGGGGGATDYGVQLNHVRLAGSYQYVTGSLGNVDVAGEVGYQLGSPARYKIVAANTTDAALIRLWATVGRVARINQHVITLTLAAAESPTGTFVLTGTLSGTAPSAGAVSGSV